MTDTIQFVSINTIFTKVLRHPLLKKLSPEVMIDYTAEFIHKLGTPQLFATQIERVDIATYRGRVSGEVVDVTNVTDAESGQVYQPAPTNSYTELPNAEGVIPIYKFQGRFIYTNTENATLNITYKTIPVDESGTPLIPDDPIFIKALSDYIKLQWFTVLFDLGEINQAVYYNAQQQYAFSVGQYTSKSTRLLPSEIGAFKAVWNNFFTRSDEADNNFNTLGLR